MPSRPLSADTKAVVKLATRLDNEAIDLAKGRTEMRAAVARLAQLIPPAASTWTKCWPGSAAGTCRLPRLAAEMVDTYGSPRDVSSLLG
ncbi:MAG TPA: hypothetical protein VFR35_02785 [Actinoplanes sp.]|nr:hypothetical protein [Actinoplanes sp.]